MSCYQGSFGCLSLDYKSAHVIRESRRKVSWGMLGTREKLKMLRPWSQDPSVPKLYTLPLEALWFPLIFYTMNYNSFIFICLNWNTHQQISSTNICFLASKLCTNWSCSSILTLKLFHFSLRELIYSSTNFFNN